MTDLVGGVVRLLAKPIKDRQRDRIWFDTPSSTRHLLMTNPLWEGKLRLSLATDMLMPTDPASDRAFNIFIEAYARAWAPKFRLDEEKTIREPPQTAAEADIQVITNIITKSKAWGDTPF